MFIPIATGEFNTKRYRLKSFPNIDLVFIFKMDTLPLKAVTYFAIQIVFYYIQKWIYLFCFSKLCKQTWN